MSKKDLILSVDNIGDYIYFIRGYKVMFDADLAMLYEVETKVLNRAVKRNMDRFPEDFAFQITQNEWGILRCQIGTSRLYSLKSQSVISKRHGGRRYMPYVFTEQGVAMLSSVLRSPQAVKVNIEIMRTFVELRHLINSNEKLSKEMEDLKSFMLKHSSKNDQEFKKVWDMFKKLMTPKEEHRKIGFNLDQ